MNVLLAWLEKVLVIHTLTINAYLPFDNPFSSCQTSRQRPMGPVVLASTIRIDGPELGEKVAAQLEGTINKPGLGFAEELKLFFHGKGKMASTVDSHICLKEAIRNVIFFQTEIHVYWVFGPGVLSKLVCSLRQ